MFHYVFVAKQTEESIMKVAMVSDGRRRSYMSKRKLDRNNLVFQRGGDALVISPHLLIPPVRGKEDTILVIEMSFIIFKKYWKIGNPKS